MQHGDRCMQNRMLTSLGLPLRMSRSLMRKALEPHQMCMNSPSSPDRLIHIEIEEHRQAIRLQLPRHKSRHSGDCLLKSIHIYTPSRTNELQIAQSRFVELDTREVHQESDILILVDVADELELSIVQNTSEKSTMCISAPYSNRTIMILRVCAPRCVAVDASLSGSMATQASRGNAGVGNVTMAEPMGAISDSPAIHTPSTCTEKLVDATTCLGEIQRIRDMYSILSNGIEAYINKCKVKEFMVLAEVNPPICETCKTVYKELEVKSGTNVSASCNHDSQELVRLMDASVASEDFKSATKSALLELDALRKWKARALSALKLQELSNLAQKERAFLVSHNIASQDLNASQHIFELIRFETGEVDEEAQLNANIDACSRNMQWFEDTSPTRARYRFKLTISPSLLEPEKFRIITARAAPSWNGLVKALTNNWDDTTNRPTRTLLNPRVMQAIETRKRKRPCKAQRAK
jgi:hypothetical protein